MQLLLHDNQYKHYYQGVISIKPSTSCGIIGGAFDKFLFYFISTHRADVPYFVSDGAALSSDSSSTFLKPIEFHLYFVLLAAINSDVANVIAKVNLPNFILFFLNLNFFY